MGELKPYAAVINGMATHLMLDEETARERGLYVEPTPAPVVEAILAEGPDPEVILAEVVPGDDGVPVIEPAEEKAAEPRPGKARTPRNKE